MKFSTLQVYKKLEKMVGVSNKLDGPYTWTLIRRMENGDFSAGSQDFYRRTECHSKLAIAWSLMKDCFEPITGRHTKIDVIQSTININVEDINSILSNINFSVSIGYGLKAIIHKTPCNRKL